jgi:hypothetical protein
MVERVITGLMLVVAVIHLLPIVGFLGAERLASLYAIEVTEKNLEILMRHRAILFGILGALFAYAAFRPALQPLAFVAAFVSLATFFYLAFSVGDFNDAIRRVVLADVVASVCLFGAIVLYALENNG